jgi:hypothetical protein
LGIEIPITIMAGNREVSLLAKVDTGALSCIFQREHAEALELDVESGEPQRFVTATGAFATYGHTVRLSSCDFDLDSMVYFAREYEFPRNVLGLVMHPRETQILLTSCEPSDTRVLMTAINSPLYAGVWDVAIPVGRLVPRSWISAEAWD